MDPVRLPHGVSIDVHDGEVQVTILIREAGEEILPEVVLSRAWTQLAEAIAAQKQLNQPGTDTGDEVSEPRAPGSGSWWGQ